MLALLIVLTTDWQLVLLFLNTIMHMENDSLLSFLNKTCCVRYVMLVQRYSLCLLFKDRILYCACFFSFAISIEIV